MSEKKKKKSEDEHEGEIFKFNVGYVPKVPDGEWEDYEGIYQEK